MDEALAREQVALLADSPALADKVAEFTAMLAIENERQNLVAKASLAQVWQRHVLDSAQLLMHVPRETSEWLDLGTGAGFPGVVVALLRPAARVTLVESRSNRVEWLERVSQELGLGNVVIEAMRVEVLQTRRFDVISARAFAPLPTLLELSARFSTAATVWALPKGRSAEQELQDLQGWNHTFHVKQSVTDPAAGIIVGQLHGRKGAPA